MCIKQGSTIYTPHNSIGVSHWPPDVITLEFRGKTRIHPFVKVKKKKKKVQNSCVKAAANCTQCKGLKSEFITGKLIEKNNNKSRKHYLYIFINYL